jgi:hypothetical protein
MARRRHELDTKASEVKHDRVQDVDVRFACVASAGAYLAELERPSEHAVDIVGEAPRKLQRLSGS